MRGADRGPTQCGTGGCGGKAVVAVLLHVNTFGSRKDRVKATSGAVRLCKKCVEELALGNVPVLVMDGIRRALAKVKEAS